MNNNHSNARAVMMLAVVPSCMLLGIGFCWERLTPALAVTSIISAMILSIGFGFATAAKRKW